MSDVQQPNTVSNLSGGLIEARLRIATECFAYVGSYEQLLTATAAKKDGGHGMYSGAARIVADKAYEAEKYVRLMLRTALDSFNELMDSGGIGASVDMLRDFMEKNQDPDVLITALNQGKKEISDAFEGLDTQVMDEAITIVNRHRPAISFEADKLHIKFTDLDEKEQEALLETRPDPWQFGRVSVDQFFGVAGTGTISTLGFPFGKQFEPGKPTQVEQETWEGMDIYSSLVGSSTALRDAFYGHAREVDELGIGEYRGATIETVVAGILLIVGIIVALIGATLMSVYCDRPGTTNAGLCILGLVLVIIGLVLAYVGCSGLPSCSGGIFASSGGATVYIPIAP